MTPYIQRQEEIGRAAVEALPEFIRIGPFNFAITKMSENRASSERRYGFCSTVEQEIGIQRNVPSAQKAVDTFLHEINHAIYYAYDLQDDDKEERTCGSMATAMVQIFRDNPWVAEWIGVWTCRSV